MMPGPILMPANLTCMDSPDHRFLKKLRLWLRLVLRTLADETACRR